MKRTYARRRLPQPVQDSPESSEDEATKVTPKRARASDQKPEIPCDEPMSRHSGQVGVVRTPSTGVVNGDLADILRTAATVSHSAASKELLSLPSGKSRRSRTRISSQNVSMPHARKSPSSRAEPALGIMLSQASVDSHASSSSSSSRKLELSQSLPVLSAPDPISMLLGHASSAGHTKRPSIDSPQKKGVMSRMLERSKTDNSITKATSSTSTPTPNMWSRASSSHPTLSRSGSQTNVPSLEDIKLDKEDNTPAPSPTRPPLRQHARTYGGASRSFLVSLPAHSAAASKLLEDGTGEIDYDTYQDLTGEQSQSQSQSQWDELEADAGRESYAALRARLGVDLSSDDPHMEELLEEEPASPVPSPSKHKGNAVTEAAPKAAPLPPGMMNDLKSITELRSKGESRRFLDDVGYLFEGLERSSPIGVRRGSALEIVTKLCDHEFARKSKAVDFLQRTWDVFRQAGAGDGDKVLDALLVLFASLATRNPAELRELAVRTKFAEPLIKMLPVYGRGKDVLAVVSTDVRDAELRKVGVLKSEKTMLRAIVKLFETRSDLYFEYGRVHMTDCIVRVLSMLPPELLSSTDSGLLANHLLQELDLFPSRVRAYSVGLPLLPEATESGVDMPSFDNTNHSLRLFDSFLLQQWHENEEESGDQDPLESPAKKRSMVTGLFALMVASLVQTRNADHEGLHDSCHECIRYALRILVHLSHDSSAWSSHIVGDEYAALVTLYLIITYSASNSEARNEHNVRLFDHLCLALALLTSVTKHSQDFVQRTVLSKSCSLDTGCLQGTCHCPGVSSGLRGLVSTFSDHAQASQDSPNSAFISGHLSVLLGLMMKDSPANQTEILDALPRSSRQTNLDMVIESARTFDNTLKFLMEDENEDTTPSSSQNINGSGIAADSLAVLDELRAR